MVSNLLSIFSVVWSFAKHALVCDHTHGKVVNGDSMVLTAHDLWSHIAWSSRRVLGVLRIPSSCNSQISYSQIAAFVKNEILGLDISVQNGVLVQIFQAKKHACDEKLYDLNKEDTD